MLLDHLAKMGIQNKMISSSDNSMFIFKQAEPMIIKNITAKLNHKFALLAMTLPDLNNKYLIRANSLSLGK
jgi:hypothetical protein